MPSALRQLDFDREYNFSPSIVFDALVDPDLLGGWLAIARVEPHVGGAFDLVWPANSSLPPTSGVITALDAPNALEVSTDNRGTIRFDLEPREDPVGGSYATRFHAHVEVAMEKAFLPRAEAEWNLCFDQLDELLRGRPVDWTRPGHGTSGARRNFGCPR